MAKILFAEDDEAMRSMVTDMLVSAGHSVTAVADGNTALANIRVNQPDLVLLDYRMGTPDGFEVCRRIKSDPGLEHIPVLLLTAEHRVENRIAGFGAGANDYLPKPFDARELVARVQALLRLSEQGRALNPTTGLPGGVAIEKELERRRSSGLPFTLGYLDLDYFKPFNDRFGFATANRVIEVLGELLRAAVAGTDHFMGHVGGDDFILMSSPESARPLIAGVQDGFRRELAKLLPPEVIEKGSYRGKTREGNEEEIPLTRLTTALLHVRAEKMPSLAKLGEIAAEEKRRGKESGAEVIELEITE